MFRICSEIYTLVVILFRFITNKLQLQLNLPFLHLSTKIKQTHHFTSHHSLYIYIFTLCTPYIYLIYTLYIPYIHHILSFYSIYL